MKKYFLLSMLSIIMSINSCKNIHIYAETVASFSMNKTTAKVGETIIFTNLSKNAQDYQWVFGDGGVSNEKNPIHSYSSAGTFTIKLYSWGNVNSLPPVDEATKTILITLQDIK